MSEQHDVVVIGGGPSGSACAYWLANHGVDVAVVEKKEFPREKTCGDGLTPRALRQLEDMGMNPTFPDHHQVDGLRLLAFGRELEVPWPEQPGLGRHGKVVSRFDLDHAVAAHAEAAGAIMLQKTEAIHPLFDEAGHVNGVQVRRLGETSAIRGRYLVIADGSNSRIGRALGAGRDREAPMGMAIRGYFLSDRHDDPMMEGHLDLRDSNGANLPGYGWIFPMGDGRVNVGAGLLSTFRGWKDVNTTTLMDAFVAGAPKPWGLSAATACAPPTGGKLPMGFAVGPVAGATHIHVGDAAGAINPFNGEGISYALETGRLGAECLVDALAANHCALDAYAKRLTDTYGLYYQTAKIFVRVIGNPALMRAFITTGMHSFTLMEWTVRILNNMLRPREVRAAEAAYRAMSALVGR